GGPARQQAGVRMATGEELLDRQVLGDDLVADAQRRHLALRDGSPVIVLARLAAAVHDDEVERLAGLLEGDVGNARASARIPEQLVCRHDFSSCWMVTTRWGPVPRRGPGLRSPGGP